MNLLLLFYLQFTRRNYPQITGKGVTATELNILLSDTSVVRSPTYNLATQMIMKISQVEKLLIPLGISEMLIGFNACYHIYS